MKHRQSTASNTVRTTILAVGGTVAFYLFAPTVPGIAPFVKRYFCSHPLEYISTAMFFTGMAILVQKFVRLRSERRMLALAETADFQHRVATDSYADREAALTEWCAQQKSLKHTELYQRMQGTLHYLTGTRREGLEEHLRYLAELASERLHQTYATLRTITWAIPILGFLGTVIGITMAIANVTPEQLDSSLAEVTGGLAVAFDTTALALGMSIVMVFASFAVERSEQQVLGEVEQFGIEHLLPLFGAPSQTHATEEADSLAAGNLYQVQSEIWAEQIAELRSTWSDLLQQHADSMRQTLDAEVQFTLQLHREQSLEARDAYTAALQTTSQAIVSHNETFLTNFDDRISAWQQALLTSSQSSAQQSEALHELGATLLKMSESEERLTELQKLLSDNLQALQVADTMERTANSLTAAVHVLTAKHAPRSAA